ncbi:MAG TPA: Hsp20/alpha crystallin family protein [Nitrososphaera sp.]|jgi:HSP20 family protein
MKKSGKIVKRQERHVMHLDDVFENFRREIENTMRPWSTRFGFPSLFDSEGIRLPLCDMADKGNRYEVHVEIPGIDKDKLNVKATKNSVEVSAEKSERSEERRKGYFYSERSQRSFYRMIPVPEEIVPSKVAAKVNNGILTLELPKRKSSKAEQSTKVEVK